LAFHQGLEVLIGIAVALLLTWLLLIAAIAIRRHKGKELQLEAAYRRFSPSGNLPGRNRRLRLTLLVLAALVILNLVWLGLLLYRAPGERAVESAPTQNAAPGGPSSSTGPSASDPRITPPSTTTPGAGANTGSGSAEAIQLEDLADSARPFQTVRIQGTYHGGANTFLRVQRWEGGKWLAFPLPTKTDQSGRFTTHVEFDQPGRYQLRVLDPNSGVTSKPFVLVIKG
jgi:hypothetical protein